MEGGEKRRQRGIDNLFGDGASTGVKSLKDKTTT